MNSSFPHFSGSYLSFPFTARRNESTVQKRKVPTAALFFAETKHWEDMTPVSFIWRIPARVTLLTQVKHERAEWNYCLTHLYCRWTWWFTGLGSREWNEKCSMINQNPKPDFCSTKARRALYAHSPSHYSLKATEKALRRVWLHTVFYLGECEHNQLNPAFTQGHITLQRQEMHTNRNKDLRWVIRTSQWTGRGEIIGGERTYLGIMILTSSMKDIDPTK